MSDSRRDAGSGSMIRRSSVGAASALLLLGATAAWAVDPDGRLRVVEYRPDLVLPLTTFLGYHVHIEFAPDERFLNLGSGDTTGIDVGAEGNHLLLKPKAATSGTNLTVLTNRHVYFFDFRALARPPRPGEAVYSITYRYPPPDAAPLADQNKSVDGALAGPLPALNRNYWYCGSPALRPVAATDDGLQIRLTFAAQTLLPAIFAREADGEEALVNSHVEDDTIVIHHLVRQLVLRRGTLVGCVVNRGDPAEARRAAGGTVNQAVTRDTVRPQP
jgi:type IV secretion system protein VirB9